MHLLQCSGNSYNGCTSHLECTVQCENKNQQHHFSYIASNFQPHIPMPCSASTFSQLLLVENFRAGYRINRAFATKYVHWE